MKKIFALFLAFALLCLTACNTKPPVGTDTGGQTTLGTTNGTETPEDKNWLAALQGQVVSESAQNELIDLPSRIVFEYTVAGAGDYGGNQTYTFYYSKADGKAYVYCFDPLCDHKECMANLANNTALGWDFRNTVFYENRFYSLTTYGQMLSFAFDGTDKKIEYDLNYEFPENIRYTVWHPCGLYGPYLYISLNINISGSERQMLRYNLETKEMENLTEKTGNYVSPNYFYNGMIYGNGMYIQTGDSFLRADLDLNEVEILDESVYLEQSVGSIIVGDVYAERNSVEEMPRQSGISFYNIETGERRVMTKEELGLEGYPRFIYATDEYLYFYVAKSVEIGTITININGKEIKQKVTKRNDGKLYRMNPDGTDIVCVYDNPDYELNENMVIYGDKIVMQGRYIDIENGEKKVWGGPIQVATIHPDGTFGEFVEVEILQ